MSRLLAALMMAAFAAGQTVSSREVQIESVEKSSGPYRIKGHEFTVALQVKRLRSAGKVDPDFGETVAGMEIRDETGTVHYRRTFPYEIEGDRFSDTTDVYAEMLRGTKGEGLLITYGILPSTPLGGQSWQVFGVVGGKLAPFSKPLSTYGELITRRAGTLAGTSWDSALQADVLNFRVWTGNFFVILPLRVDWVRGTMAPAYRCWKLTPSGPKASCRLDVEAERRASDDLTFVRLFPYAESGGIAAHAVVKKDSSVEFVSAEAEVRWEEMTEHIEFGVSEDVWLEVRVDGKHGWIHTQEDFLAIGLPMAG